MNSFGDGAGLISSSFPMYDSMFAFNPFARFAKGYHFGLSGVYRVVFTE